jgi:ABC-2 type transport system permease protein
MDRLAAMIVKEMWAILFDAKSRIILVIPPLLQLFVFSYCTTLEVRNVTIGVHDRSGGVHAAELVERLAGSPTFREVKRYHSADEVRRAIDRQAVIAVVVIDSDFDARISRRQHTDVGVILDGRKSNAAQIVASYVSRIAAETGAGAAPRGPSASAGSTVTNWYNPTLNYIWFTLPSLIAIIVPVGGLALSSQTVARERELGTFDQLMVAPLRIHEILIGKMVPPFLIGMANGLAYFVLAQIVFGVPFLGSFLLLLLALTVYVIALVGVGMLVSVLSATQQQAFLGSFLVITPLIMLCGYAAPIENMPDWMQIISYADPIRYFLVIVQGLFLKALSAADVFQQLWPLVLIALISLGLSAWMFRARME